MLIPPVILNGSVPAKRQVSKGRDLCVWVQNGLWFVLKCC